MPSAATVVVGAGPAGLAAAPIVAAAVVVATGYTHEPAVPGWAQPKGAGLPVVHSSGYRDAAP
ncbi:MAG TPA: hypothetical protein VGJ11_07140 [Gaiellales bacterium]|jgi:cation diffusion facilitator CzcD-associated flavoprotein CzcO